MPPSYVNYTINVQGFKTHYLEAGVGNDETIVLIHSGEYGASAEMSWQFNIPALAEKYHIVAPDLLGYGGTDKIFDFEDMFDRRINHISTLLETLDIQEAFFVGNSMGAGYLGSLACEDPPLDWPIKRMVLISGGGTTPEGFGEIIKNYNGNKEGMKDIMAELYYDPNNLGEEFLERKVELSKTPGHWQVLSAIRYEAPFEQEREFRRQHNYENVDIPTLIIGGEDDTLHPKHELEEVAGQMGARTRFFGNCKHSAHIEHTEAVNRLILNFFDAAGE